MTVGEVREATERDIDSLARLIAAFRDHLRQAEPDSAGIPASLRRLLHDPDAQFLVALDPFKLIVAAAGILATALGWWLIDRGFTMPLWVLVSVLLFCMFLVPLSVMSLIASVVGADVIVDARKGSATWQQGYLGMGIGTKELVPFEKIDHLEVTVEGAETDRWREQDDDLRQFALVLVKRSGKRLTIAQVPVPSYGQADGMDRTLAVGQAVAKLVGSNVTIPADWQLVEIDTKTGEALPAPAPQKKRTSRGRRR